jgi:hypothetical protein
LDLKKISAIFATNNINNLNFIIMNKILRFSLLSLLTLFCGISTFAADETIDFTQLAITTSTTGFTFSSSSFTFTADKVDGTNAPTQNGKAKDIRLYAKNTLKIESTKSMTKIVFNMSTQGLTQWGDITPSTGTVTVDVDAKTTTWTNTTAVSSVTFTVGATNTHGTNTSKTSAQFDFNSATFTTEGAATSISAPTISGTTPFVGSTDVTITGAAGSTIYYTLDGTDPTATSTLTGASPLTFTLSKSATVKAIAVSGTLTSTIASKDFTMATYTDATIADLNTYTADKQFINLTLTNAKVVYVDVDKKTTIYVREGSKAIMLFDTGLTLALNSIISGNVKFDYDNYYGIHEVVKNTDTNINGLTITPATSTVLDPVSTTISELCLNHIADLVKLTGVTITSTTSSSKTYYYANLGTDQIQLYGSDDLCAKYAGDGNTHTIIAGFNNIYSSKAEIKPFDIDGVTAGLNTIAADNDNANSPIYNLAGQRVNKSYKGVIIQNGKKMINK